MEWFSLDFGGTDHEFFHLSWGFQVQKHFQWNSPPVKYDAFHMVMYDLWLRHHVIKYWLQMHISLTPVNYYFSYIRFSQNPRFWVIENLYWSFRVHFIYPCSFFPCGSSALTLFFGFVLLHYGSVWCVNKTKTENVLLHLSCCTNLPWNIKLQEYPLYSVLLFRDKHVRFASEGSHLECPSLESIAGDPSLLRSY